jgi:2-C-methyl-D-erythritol 2,4-cyclodiphosphate synthase
LIHAIIDALLGAAGLGDIGQHFPDTDKTFKDINSRKLLRTVVETLKSNNYIIGNIDATIICEAPKMKSYIKQMITNIADDCMCGLSNVNIKATTTERLGFIGRSEGVAAQAICLIETV